VVAALPGYVRPDIVDSATAVLDIKGGRHPMIEAAWMGSGSFVPNDIDMAAEGPRLYVISGANMGGKSTYIRSMALIVILAQIGSYVPADSARLSVFDAVHTRMGARDALASGQSTFMVELSETNGILRAATPRSLIILDELGRGTSTADGVAIAHATSEYILTHVRACTLFVTHYPLLARLEDAYPQLVRNWHMAYVENSPTEVPIAAAAAGTAVDEGDASVRVPSITFLFKLAPGPAPSSFGLNVARMAHVSEQVLQRAAVMAQRMRQRNQLQQRRRERIAQKQAWELMQELMQRTDQEGGQDGAQEAVQRILDLCLSLPSAT